MGYSPEKSAPPNRPCLALFETWESNLDATVEEHGFSHAANTPQASFALLAPEVAAVGRSRRRPGFAPLET